MTNNLAVMALGSKAGDLVAQVSGLVSECGCNIQDSRMTLLGEDFAILMLIEGNCSELARLENALKRAEKDLSLRLLSHRTGNRPVQENLLPYLVEVVTLDRRGIIHSLSRFFADRDIGIQELASHSYAAAHTGAPMFSVSVTIGIPADTPLAALRDEFFDFCDQLNVDAVLEPVKV